MDNPYENFITLRESRRIVANELVGKEFESVLEVGCQWGESLVAIKEKFPGKKLVGVDIDTEVLKEARKITHIDLLDADLFELPFPDKEFDVVFTNALFCVLEPSRIEEGLKELVRVTKKHLILVEFETDAKNGLIPGGRTGANWVKLLRKYGLEATKEKVTEKVSDWIDTPWVDYGYIYYAKKS